VVNLVSWAEEEPQALPTSAVAILEHLPCRLIRCAGPSMQSTPGALNKVTPLTECGNPGDGDVPQG
jgi:hypothetical protein